MIIVFPGCFWSVMLFNSCWLSQIWLGWLFFHFTHDMSVYERKKGEKSFYVFNLFINFLSIWRFISKKLFGAHSKWKKEEPTRHIMSFLVYDMMFAFNVLFMSSFLLIIEVVIVFYSLSLSLLSFYDYLLFMYACFPYVLSSIIRKKMLELYFPL